jgi:hypothetical protein
MFLNTYSDEICPLEGPFPKPTAPVDIPEILETLDHLAIADNAEPSQQKWKLLSTTSIPTRSETVQETDDRGYALGKEITTHYVRMVWTWELVGS